MWSPPGDGSDLARAHAALFVDGAREDLPGVLQRRDVGKERRRVEEDRVPAEGHDDRHACRLERLAEVLDGTDPVAEVVLFHALSESLRDGLEVPAGQSAIGGEAFGQDLEVPAAFRELLVVHREPAADVGERVLLGGHGHAVGERRGLSHDVRHGTAGVTGFARLHEPCVLGEAACVEEEGNRVAVAGGAHLTQVGHAHRLAAAGVARDRDHDERNIDGPICEQVVEGDDCQVSFERVTGGRHERFGYGEVHRLCARVLDVGPRRVEVDVVGDHLAGSADGAEEDVLGGSALVRGQDVAEWEEVGDRFFETEVRRSAGVRFVAPLDRRPLLGRHCPGA